MVQMIAATHTHCSNCSKCMKTAAEVIGTQTCPGNGHLPGLAKLSLDWHPLAPPCKGARPTDPRPGKPRGTELWRLVPKPVTSLAHLKQAGHLSCCLSLQWGYDPCSACFINATAK